MGRFCYTALVLVLSFRIITILGVEDGLEMDKKVQQYKNVQIKGPVKVKMYNNKQFVVVK